jgi:hypothetical protein
MEDTVKYHKKIQMRFYILKPFHIAGNCVWFLSQIWLLGIKQSLGR